MFKVYHFNEMESFFGGDEWKLEINISDLWQAYKTSQIQLSEFNNKYALRLNENKDKIVGLGANIWNELVPLINKVNNLTEVIASSDAYDDIYDWADKHDVLIKTK